MDKQKGFTLLELLMVVIIIGVLATIALPQYLKFSEKARTSEALSILGQLRASEMRYYAQYSTYTTSFGALDFDPTAVGALRGTSFFTYALPAATATTFNVTAARNSTRFSTNSGCSTGYVLCIDEIGTLIGDSCTNTATSC